MKNITAAILAGGLGTRLEPLLEGTPKVLARVAGRPFVSILLDRLESAGVKKVVLLTGHLGGEVCDALGNRYGAMTLDYSVELTPLGTAGALRYALSRISTEMILLMNGDSYCGLSLNELIAAHLRQHAEVSLTLTNVSDADRYGRVECNASGRLTSFAEKQTESGTGWINAGVYVLRRSIVNELLPGRPISLEREVLPAWVRQGRAFGYRSNGPFLDIGTPQSYAQANAFFKKLHVGVAHSAVTADAKPERCDMPQERASRRSLYNAKT